MRSTDEVYHHKEVETWTAGVPVTGLQKPTICSQVLSSLKFLLWIGIMT